MRDRCITFGRDITHFYVSSWARSFGMAYSISFKAPLFILTFSALELESPERIGAASDSV